MQSRPRLGPLARLVVIVPTLAQFILSALASRASAQQVIKPTGTITTRLPTPGPVVARQLSNGTIEVQWKTIAGAAKYQVTRSVPPTAAQVVANPTDTIYVDTSVQAGSSYYYVVAAVDSAGGIGLKSGSQPVTATTTAAGSTGGPAVGTGPTLVAPLAVQADDTPTNWVEVYFSFSQSGMSYTVERATVTTGSTTPPAWIVRVNTGPRPCCSYSIPDQAVFVNSGETVYYRVRTVDPAAPSRTSTWTTSPGVWPSRSKFNSVNSVDFLLKPVWAKEDVMVAGSVKVIGPSLSSTDTTIVAINNARGEVIARKPGVTWVFSAIVGYSGQPDVRARRITVLP